MVIISIKFCLQTILFYPVCVITKNSDFSTSIFCLTNRKKHDIIIKLSDERTVQKTLRQEKLVLDFGKKVYRKFFKKV